MNYMKQNMAAWKEAVAEVKAEFEASGEVIILPNSIFPSGLVIHSKEDLNDYKNTMFLWYKGESVA